MNRAHCVLVLSVFAGCTETIHLSSTLQDLVAIEIAPADATITLTDLAPPFHTLQYTAMGRFRDGTIRDVSANVEWAVDNTLLGNTDPHGLFTASHAAAGRVVVSVHAADLDAAASLAVIIDTVIVDPVFPPPALDLFPPGVTVVTGGPNAPAIAYPADGTTFPQGLSSTLFQYARGSANNDAFRIAFDSDVLHLVIETGADRWLATDSMHTLLAASGLAGPIQTNVRATSSTANGTVYASAPISLRFVRDQPSAPIYFWSAATNGVVNGGLDLTTSRQLYPETSTTCVGCHTVSRSGTQMAMAYDNATSFDVQTIYLPSLTTGISATSARPMAWSTYSPDGLMLLVANNGILTLLDATTGAPLGALNGQVPLPSMKYATHPDWSPDGSYVAVALTSIAPSALDVKAASIARIAYNGGAWGSPIVLVPGSATNNNYFPKWSPDGRFLAYVTATSGSQGAKSAELMIVDGAGGTPRALRLASHRVDTRDDVPDLANTMPAWSSFHSDRAWIAFVSSRSYGVMPIDHGQIWIAAVDLDLLGDPSSAAFWLPCQDVTVLNNNPSWTGGNPTL